VVLGRSRVASPTGPRGSLSNLHEIAGARGATQMIVYTQPEWPDAVGFYKAHGFEPFDRDEVDVHFRRRID